MSGDIRLLTEYGAANVLHVSVETIRRLERDGQLPSVHLPGEIIRFRLSDLQNWIQIHSRRHIEPLTTR